MKTKSAVCDTCLCDNLVNQCKGLRIENTGGKGAGEC